MTADELERLTEALLDEFRITPATLRGGGDLAGFDDELFMLAFRFLSGERVQPLLSQGRPDTKPAHRAVQLVDGDEAERRLSELDQLEHEDEVDNTADGFTLKHSAGEIKVL